MRAARITLSLSLALAMLAAVFAGGVSVASASGTTRWVDIASGDNANTGTSASPLRTIEAAISASVSGDTIMVRPGTYGADAEQDFPILLPPGVTLKSTDGPFATRIQGNASQRVIDISDAVTDTVVSGFAITNGAGDGAGIRIRRTVAGDVAGWPLIEDCNLWGNGTATSDGAAILVIGTADGIARPRIVRTDITANTGDTYAVLFGGNTNASMVDCSVEGNLTGLSGGIGVTTAFPGGGATFERCRVRDNQGRGIYFSCSGGDYSIRDCVIWGNTRSGIHAYSAPLEVERTQICENAALTVGGGLELWYGSATLSDCLIASNSAPQTGGAVYAVFSTATFENCTVAYNSSTSGWAGIWADTEAGGSAVLKNSIVWGHGGEDVNGATAIDYSCTEDDDLAPDHNTVGTGVIHSDPMFHSMSTFSYRLEPGSPCIDTGDPADYSATDAFGRTRPIDGDADGTAVPDMGCYEYLGTSTSASAPSTTGYGGRATVTARARDAFGAVLPGRWVAFDYSPDGISWTLFAQALTDSSGSASVVSHPMYSRTLFRARYVSDTAYPTSQSATLSVKPKALVGTPVAPSTMSRTKYYTVYGTLKPRHTAGKSAVRIYRYRYVSGRWKSYGYTSATSADYRSYSRYSKRVRLPYAGRWRLRAYAPADGSHASAWSSRYDYVTVK